MSEIKPGPGAVRKALVGSSSGGYQVADDVDLPSLKPGTMLCWVHAVALNPYDAKTVELSNVPGAVGGCDFAGIIVAVGEGVTRFRKGDRVLALTFGLNVADKSAGAFAEYAIATEDLCCHVPENLSFAQASSMGLGIATAGLALFQASGLRLAMPDSGPTNADTNPFVLVSGGATGTGTAATQLLKIAGYTPIVTCSPANNALCESYGAAACFDYHSPSCGADIRDYTADGLISAFDCVSESSTMQMCYEAIGSSGGSYIGVEAIHSTVKYTRRDIRADWLMAPTITGAAVELAGAYGRPETPEDRRFGKSLFLMVERLLKEGSYRNHPFTIREGGLEKIPSYVDDLRTVVRPEKQVVLLVSA